MALQTNVFRNGEWVTETVDLQSLLRTTKQSTQGNPPRQRTSQPPSYGILTRTVIESPVAHWILPVRLRSAQHMDVAIVGDHYVQISELGRDGQLHEVIRKNDFGARIRNAKVIGSSPESTADKEEDDDDDVDIKLEDDTRHRHDGNGDSDSLRSIRLDDIQESATVRHPRPRTRLPPQQLLVVLENGDCIFLFLQLDGTNHLEFVTTQYQPPGHRIIQPGFHAAVDPSSRYMALACTEDLFVVYELESPRSLNRAHVRGDTLRPIRTFHPRAVQGVIHKMEFLYPHPSDDYQVILLLLVVRNGKSRMVTYEWEAGDDLASVLRVEKKGQPLPPQHQMPLLIVPLTLDSAFFAISVRHIGVCKNAVNPPAEFDDFLMEVQETSRFHHGRGVPLWSAWTRPYRLPTYNTTRDSIYLAREDGVVMFLDIDSDNILGASVEIGKFDCNIGTSFCSLFDDFNDILIMGGDSGPGTIWQIRPRQPNTQLGTIPNWSPVADLITTDEFSSERGTRGHESPMVPWRNRVFGTFREPDRVFATSGRGVTGALTELRRGFRANIGLDIDYEALVKRCWIFPVRTKDHVVVFHMILTLLDKSVVVYLSQNLTLIEPSEDDTASYDLESRTVAAHQITDEVVVQVTESRFMFVGPLASVSHLHSDVFDDTGVTVADVSFYGSMAAINTHSGTSFHIRIVRFSAAGSMTVIKTIDMAYGVTCLCLTVLDGRAYIGAGVFDDGHPGVCVYEFDDNDDTNTDVLEADADSEIDVSLTLYVRDANNVEAFSSIVLVSHDAKTVAMLGTRGGDVVALSLDAPDKPAMVRLGISSVWLTVFEDATLGTSVLACCDGRISLHSGLDVSKVIFRSSQMVWVVDAADPNKPQPSINATAVLCQGFLGRNDKTQLIFCSGTRILVSELHPYPGTVQRTLPLQGTPMKVLYSHILGCLVVATKDLNNKTTLQFLDPNTGEDLSLPTDRNGNPVDFVSGLGKSDDQILGLGEWSYEREGNQWLFLLVSTKGGRFLVLSTLRVENRAAGAVQSVKIKYWTRYKKPRFPDSVYSVVGWGENVFYCVGNAVFWDTIDLEARRLVSHGSFELSSFATQLRIVNGKIVALTYHDSIEIIDFLGGTANDMSLYHADSEARSSTHCIEIGSELIDGRPDASLLFVADRNATVAGLWVPWDQPGKDCTAVFEADLPASVRKLVRGRTRPSWQQAQRDVRYGLVPSTPDAAEILGVCLDGSLQHMTILSMPIWRILRLIQDIALRSPVLYPFTYEEAPVEDGDAESLSEPRSAMQIDGDMLQRCLDQRHLETLFTQPGHAERLFALLDKLDDGEWTTPFTKALRDSDTQDATMHDAGTGPQRDNSPAKAPPTLEEQYFGLLYDILEYYLAPVM